MYEKRTGKENSDPNSVKKKEAPLRGDPNLYLEAWARIALVPGPEARSMPIGALSDAISAYQIVNGMALEDIPSVIHEGGYIPNLK